MMCKKLICLVSVLVLSFACTTYADVLLGDFENGSLDGWVAWPDSGCVLSNGTVGVTSGNSSLDVTSPGVYWAIQWNLSDLQALDLTNVTTLEMDVTMLVDNFEDGTWTNVDKIAINSDFDWREIQRTSVIDRDTGEPASSTDWGTWSGDQNRTIIWDIGADGYNWAGLEDSSFVSISISLQGAGLFHIDNIRLNGAEIKDRELYPTLKLDVQNTNEAANVEEGFTAFTPADSGSEFDGITVTLDGYAEADARRRDVPTGVEKENIYRDFIFGRQSEAGVGYASITLAGLEPNETYGITIYSWDTYSTELRVTDWTANGEALMTTTHDGNLDPPSGDDQAFTALAAADPNGVILMEATPGEGTFAAEPFAFVNALVISSLTPQPGAKIIWVTETVDRNEDGVQDDQPWIDMLTAEGYDVDVQMDRWLTLGDDQDPNDANDYIAELNAADMVIISRTASSGGYATDANEVAAWASVKSPIISISAWHIRSNRLQWINSTTVNRTLDTFMLALETDHPIFDGVALEDGLVEIVFTEGFADGFRGNCVIGGIDVGNGTLIGQSFSDETVIAEWPAGVAGYEGADVVQAGPRMLFCAGTENASLSSELFPQGGWNLTDAGEQMFLNAIEYMLPEAPKVIWVTETVDRDEDGVQDDQPWIDKLAAAGYDVDVQPDRYLTLGDDQDPNDANDYVAELNAADLVIISRTASSGGYASDANEVAAWASVTAPMMSLSAWHVRSNRLQWVLSTTVNRTLDTYMLALETDHAIFEGVTLEDGLVEIVFTEGFADGYQGNCVIGGIDVGNGTLIGQSFSDETMIAEWPAGMAAYEGADVVQAGPRMLFCGGTENASLSAELFPQGGWNLTDAGEQMFLNAADYMISK